MSWLVGALVLAGCADVHTPSQPSPSTPTPFTDGAVQTGVADYIVLLRNAEQDVSGTAARLAATEQGRVKITWKHALKGFLVELTPAAAVAMGRKTEVVTIEKDGMASVHATQTPVGSWGQDRVDQRSLPLDNSYAYSDTAPNVHAYIIDTGILPSHSEFAGRLGVGVSYILDGRGTTDCWGHGSHVAGTVGGTTYGLAKRVTLHPVRVFGCSGTSPWSVTISGIDWVAANAIKPAVANMSFGGSALSAVDVAVSNLIAAGLVAVVSAGNNDGDACTQSPARVPAAITVSSSNIADFRGALSNFGPCTDLFAPGENITSAWIGSPNATNTISGTSMAAPHVAGAAALYLSANPMATPAQVESALTSNATPNVITNAGAGSPNLLLYTGFMSSTLPPVTGRIAFMSKRDGNPEIYTMNANGSSQTKVTFNSVADDRPAWSPDGSRIAFETKRSKKLKFDIYVMNVNGSGQTALTKHTGNDQAPTWSPDGSKIAFVSDRDGNAEIYVMNANGTGQTRLTTTAAYEANPAWSPDGTRIAYMSGGEIYLMDVATGALTRLTSNGMFNDDPAWSPDGSRIAFQSYVGPGPFVNAEIFVMNADGSGVQRLTNDPAYDFGPTWSPDGARIAFASDRAGVNNQEIYMVSASGTALTRLTTSPPVDAFPSWAR